MSGHSFALALDVSHLIFRDARKLSVKKHWKDHSRIDPCEKPGSGKTPRQKRLRRITCETGEFDLFSVILTPHFNRAHYDHLHMELDDTQYMFIR